ncbi:MAG TPA: bifunctional 2-polyprenyl-6-hydroxyphenol methylase/3-demethylubiquinol 3-O-methyltransferase UbiG [Stellaceae bacterium]|nr:bifunctional 2-polyprenyl-6-hydroxyphenol methylase/3-demethylubiquinol 3-O-methyltransferase UbiG [Stellaceae bacterium]
MAGTADRDEIARFAAQSAGWWDPMGEFGPLHRLNPVRLEFIRTALVARFGRDPHSLRPFAGLSLVDIGCGGGLIAEPMARLGFRVTGIDAAEPAIRVAREHSAESGLDIDYRVAAAEDLAGETFDAVLALELIEHVADRDAFFAAASALVAPGGAFVGATLNRTKRAFALAVVGAEYVLGWLPRGTHDWRRFVRPSEFVLGLRRHGLAATRMAGMRYAPGGDWELCEDLAVNYMLMAERPG